MLGVRGIGLVTSLMHFVRGCCGGYVVLVCMVLVASLFLFAWCVGVCLC